MRMIPPSRPVLLIFDGHSSHLSIDVIEYARSNGLYLSSHTSHILQPLDVGVFKSFKTYFSKVCRQYIAKNPGRVVTEEVFASLVGEAFGQSHTPLNILSGFKKNGIYPFNPGEIRDRQLAPSTALRKQTPQVPTFSQEQVALFEVRYKEGYDLEVATYLQWKNIYHLEANSTASNSPGHTVVSSSSGAASIRVTCSSVSVC